MSILIKGIDMPKGAEVISLAIASDKIWCAVFNGKYECIDAEAIPIPTPHGRLVDARQIEKGNGAIWECEIDHLKYQDRVCDIINSAPTVIEAEE